MRECPVEGTGGEVFTECVWEAEGELVARVLLLHGMGTSGGEYAPLGEWLVRCGVEVRALNLRAGARDPDERRRGDGFDFALLREDFLAWVESVDGGEVPLFLVGESMGGLLAIRLLSEEAIGKRFRGAILLCPVVSLARKTPDWQKKVLRGVAWIFPRLVLKPGWFVSGKREELVLTRNREYQEYLQRMPHRVRRYTVRFLAGVDWLMEQAWKRAGSFRVPVLLLNGEEDVFIRPEQARGWFREVGAEDREQIVYAGSQHLLLHEENTEEVLRDIRRWIGKRAEGFHS